MKKILFSCFLFLVCSQMYAAPQLSSSAKISAITCGPGAPLYSSFGHSCFRVQDTANNLDVIFNYGTFEFDQPNFYLKFARGKLEYYLSTASFDRFRASYRAENRFLIEQILDLTAEEKQELFDYLVTNHMPENRYYLYDFFFDNCTTRQRDALLDVFGDSLVFRKSLVPANKTFRQLIDEYLYGKPWSDFGIDLALGSVIDAEAEAKGQMFLPDYFMQYMELAKLGNHDLVESTSVILKGQKMPVASPHPFTPFNIFSTLFLVIATVTWFQYKRGQSGKWLDFTIFMGTGLTGIMVFLLWFATNHQATQANLNLLWANPLHVILALLFVMKAPRSITRAYLIIQILILVWILIGWTNHVQSFHLTVIPLSLIQIVRGVKYLLSKT